MQQMDLTAMDFPDNYFDIFICAGVLEHIKDDEKALQEVHRVLKPTGTAVIWIPIGYYDDPKGLSTIEFSHRMFYGREGHWRSYGLDFKEMFNSQEFSVKVITLSGSNEFLFIGVKNA